MNILHHKSWHVYNKDNIERVRRDEAAAEAEAKKKQDRVILAESEARLELLRKRANANLPTTDDNKEIKRIEHVNLFQDAQNTNNNNPEYEAEQKAKDEKWEKQITMYLDKGTEKAPWYAKLSTQNEEKYIDQHVFKRNNRQDDNPHRHRRKPLEISNDPLDYITRTLKKNEKKKQSKREHKSSSDKKKKKHGHDKSNEKSAISIEELRAKRLEREKSDQARLRSLYLNDQGREEEEEVELDDKKRSYNSQFNREETSKAQERRKKRRQ